jgi:hypothetical protein
MKPLASVASFGLVPVPPMLPGWSELHHSISAPGAVATGCSHPGTDQRVATQTELAELDLRLRRAQKRSARITFQPLRENPDTDSAPSPHSFEDEQ